MSSKRAIDGINNLGEYMVLMGIEENIPVTYTRRTRTLAWKSSGQPMEMVIAPFISTANSGLYNVTVEPTGGTATEITAIEIHKILRGDLVL